MKTPRHLRCLNCGKPREEHNSVTKACPAGRKTLLGYFKFHRRHVWTAPTSKP